MCGYWGGIGGFQTCSPPVLLFTDRWELRTFSQLAWVISKAPEASKLLSGVAAGAPPWHRGVSKHYSSEINESLGRGFPAPLPSLCTLEYRNFRWHTWKDWLQRLVLEQLLSRSQYGKISHKSTEQSVPCPATSPDTRKPIPHPPVTPSQDPPSFFFFIQAYNDLLFKKYILSTSHRQPPVCPGIHEPEYQDSMSFILLLIN